jgi:hypothetical protein
MFAVRNVYKEAPTYFKEVYCGDERQIITTDIPEKTFSLEAAWAIASLLNMGADKSGGHWETPKVDYNLWLLNVKYTITKITGSEEETNKYIDKYDSEYVYKGLYSNGFSIIDSAKEIVDYYDIYGIPRLVCNNDLVER